MVISPPNNGIIIVVLKDGELLPENLNNEKVLVFRCGDSTNRQLLMVKDIGKLADPELLKPPAEPVCNYEGGGPLHQHDDGTWWYFDETWTYENGPFATEEAGDKSLAAYCADVLAERNVLTNESESGTVLESEETDDNSTGS